MTSRTTSPLPAILLSAAAAAWLFLTLLAPLLVARGLPGTLSTRVADLVFVVGRLVCHQRPERSFHAWGVQLPVCARCFGLYAGAAFGALWAAADVIGQRRRRRHAAAGVIVADRLDQWSRRLVISSLPTVISVGLEVLGVWPQTPAIRCAAALPLGAVVAWFVGEHAAGVVDHLRKRGPSEVDCEDGSVGSRPH